MKSESEENNHKSPPKSHPKRSRRCREISTGENYGEINFFPLDLTVEILKKLPAKSLVRFRCVSKQWSSIIGSDRDFIDSIVTRSLTQLQRPHFIFYHYGSKEKSFFIFSSTYPHDTEKQKLTPKVSLPRHAIQYHYIRGLICCSMLEYNLGHNLVTIYNPTTRQSIDLPEIKSPTWPFEMAYSLFGYDPVMNQYKVLCLFNGLKNFDQSCRIYALGDPQRQWRNIQGIENRYPTIKEVYINGTFYYGAAILRLGRSSVDRTETALLSFDVRSERFDHVKTPEPLWKMIFETCIYLNTPTMVNYGGKLGCICRSNNGAETEMWVMENAEKQEWSKMILLLHHRWPNDLYLNGLKIGGILCTSTYRSKKFNVSVGVGLNVDNEQPTTCLNAVLKDLSPTSNLFTREEILGAFFHKFETFFDLLMARGFKSLEELYYRTWLHSEQKVVVEDKIEDKVVQNVVTIQGLTSSGYLLAIGDDNQMYELHPDGNSFDFLKGLVRRKL